MDDRADRPTDPQPIDPGPARPPTGCTATDPPCAPTDGRRAIVEPLVSLVAVDRVLACPVDLGPGERCEVLPADVRSTDPADLLAALDERPDLVVIHGNLSWHAIRVLAPALTSGSHRPVLAFESGPPDPIPTWATSESRHAQLRRVESVTLGIFAGVETLAEALGDSTVVRCGEGRVAAAIVPGSAPEPVQRWLRTAARLLDALEQERRSAFAARSELHERDAELHRVDLLVGEVLDSPRWLAPPLVKVFRGFERHHVLSTAGRATKRVARRVNPAGAHGGPAARRRAGRAIDVVATVLAELGRVGTVSIAKGPQLELAARADAATRRDPGSPTGTMPAVSPSDAPSSPDRAGAEPLRVTYVVPILRIAGGILGVTQLANELALLGADTRIVSAEDRAEVYRWRFLAPPTVFADAQELIDRTPPTDVVVATHWSTAAWADQIVRSGRARAAAYFLQDYEAWFYPDDPDRQAAVRASYDVIGPKIVKSDWLAGLVAADGHDTHKIVLGYDLGFFHPREVERPDHPVILAMARPRTPRRGFPTLVAALERVHREVPDVEIVLFGSDLGSIDLPFPVRSVGMVTDQEQLARLYSGAHVHIDASDFQAFGRPALEAMGCGAASVLTDVGGVGEYARHGQNCLLVPPGEPAAMADAVVRLCRDAELRRTIRRAGFDTVIGYSMKQEARSTLALFEQVAGSVS